MRRFQPSSSLIPLRFYTDRGWERPPLGGSCGGCVGLCTLGLIVVSGLGAVTGVVGRSGEIIESCFSRAMSWDDSPVASERVTGVFAGGWMTFRMPLESVSLDLTQVDGSLISPFWRGAWNPSQWQLGSADVHEGIPSWSLWRDHMGGGGRWMVVSALVAFLCHLLCHDF